MAYDGNSDSFPGAPATSSHPRGAFLRATHVNVPFVRADEPRFSLAGDSWRAVIPAVLLTPPRYASKNEAGLRTADLRAGQRREAS